MSQMQLAQGVVEGPPKRALAIIFLIAFIDLLGFGIIIPVLPFFARKFEASAFQVGLIFSLYSLCQFVASPVLGALSDRVGRRPILILSQLGSAAGYVLLALVTQHEWTSATAALWLVYLSRIIDGVSGGNASTAQAYIADVTTHENRAKGMGLLGLAFGLGFFAGPALGGLFGRDVHWPAYIAAGLSALAALLTFLLLPESRVHKPAASEVWLNPKQFAPVLQRSTARQILIISFVCVAAFVMMESSIVMFLADRFGYGPQQASWYFAFLGLIIIGVQGGLIHGRGKPTNEWQMVISGPLIVAAGLVCFVFIGFHPMVAMLIVGGAMNAVGRGIWQPTIASLLSKATDPKQHGVAFGLFHGLGGIARVVGPIVAGLVYRPGFGVGPFALAAVTLVGAAVWTGALRASQARTRFEAVTMAEIGLGVEE